MRGLLEICGKKKREEVCDVSDFESDFDHLLGPFTIFSFGLGSDWNFGEESCFLISGGGILIFFFFLFYLNLFGCLVDCVIAISGAIVMAVVNNQLNRY